MLQPELRSAVSVCLCAQQILRGTIFEPELRWTRREPSPRESRRASHETISKGHFTSSECQKMRILLVYFEGALLQPQLSKRSLCILLLRCKARIFGPELLCTKGEPKARLQQFASIEGKKVRTVPERESLTRATSAEGSRHSGSDPTRAISAKGSRPPRHNRTAPQRERPGACGLRRGFTRRPSNSHGAAASAI